MARTILHPTRIATHRHASPCNALSRLLSSLARQNACRFVNCLSCQYHVCFTLNQTKTELIWFGSSADHAKLTANDVTLRIR